MFWPIEMTIISISLVFSFSLIFSLICNHRFLDAGIKPEIFTQHDLIIVVKTFHGFCDRK